MRRILLALLSMCLLFSAARAQQVNPAARIYDPAELIPWQARYERGWRGNDVEVFRPRMTEEERAQLARLRLRSELSVSQFEPFAFYAVGEDVVMSTASLKFLDDLAVAAAWLQRNGFSQQTIADYMLMLRAWPKDVASPRPPRPLEALCIPANALTDPRVDSLANRMFNTNVVFILLHEYGHVRWRHPGNKAVATEVSRANERAADRFALDLLAKVNEAPLGLSVLFMAMAHVYEFRADLTSDAAYQAALQARTHPLSADRLHAVARHIASAGVGFTGNSRLAAHAVALEISVVANLLADNGLQRLATFIGSTVTADDLAPRKPGRHLGAPCRGAPPSGGPFAGIFRGSLTGRGTAFEVDAVLAQRGDRVTGSYSYGAGFARLDGRVTGTRLDFSWTLADAQGRGTAALRDDGIEGTWGEGSASAGVGTLVVRRQN